MKGRRTRNKTKVKGRVKGVAYLYVRKSSREQRDMRRRKYNRALAFLSCEINIERGLDGKRVSRLKVLSWII